MERWGADRTRASGIPSLGSYQTRDYDSPSPRGTILTRGRGGYDSAGSADLRQLADFYLSTVPLIISLEVGREKTRRVFSTKARLLQFSSPAVCLELREVEATKFGTM